MILIFSAENIDLRISEFKNYVCIIYLNIFSIKDGSIWPAHGTDLEILMALRCWSEWTILQSSKPRMKKLMNNSTEITDRKRQDSNNNFLFLYNKHFLLPDFVNFKNKLLPDPKSGLIALCSFYAQMNGCKHGRDERK